MANKNTKPESTSTESKKDQNDIDLKIFQEIKMECDETKTQIISNCSFMERLIIGLKYYNVMINDKNINKSKVSKEIFIEFCNQIYTNYLDDFAHFIKKHSTNEQLIE
eukprot:110074_1